MLGVPALFSASATKPRTGRARVWPDSQGPRMAPRTGTVWCGERQVQQTGDFFIVGGHFFQFPQICAVGTVRNCGIYAKGYIFVETCSMVAPITPAIGLLRLPLPYRLSKFETF